MWAASEEYILGYGWSVRACKFAAPLQLSVQRVWHLTSTQRRFKLALQGRAVNLSEITMIS
jgi:hypothetical protein